MNKNDNTLPWFKVPDATPSCYTTVSTCLKVITLKPLAIITA